MKLNVFEYIEEVIRKNLNQRRMESAYLKGELEKSARSLADASTVLIVTGFVIRDTMTGETDGPPGAITLANALEAMGKRAVIVTDQYSVDIIISGLMSKGAVTTVEVVPPDKTCGFCDGLLEKYKPSHIVAIERPGRARDGRCYSMRGEDLSDIVPNTDLLFEKAKEGQITTIAIGDGGNEVGMGKVKPHIIGSVQLGDKICAEFAADYLIAAGVSNWGAYALAAALSLLSQKMLLHDLPTEIKLLDQIVQAGAVDGCTKKRTLTVDGLSLEENLTTYGTLRRMVELSLKNGREFF